MITMFPFIDTLWFRRILKNGALCRREYWDKVNQGENVFAAARESLTQG